MAKTVRIADLAGTAELAERLCVQRSTISQWRARDVGFPDPIAFIGGSAVWDWRDVERWADRRG
jgi:predicted DNA-binding transcriptional regulator AlpA